jgi:pimeloyl-ACP methyl ester carboxylesterase
MITFGKLHSWRMRVGLAVTAVAGVVLLLSAGTPAGAGTRVEQRSAAPRSTIVLVHGAWADSSSWSGVVRRLLDARYRVEVFPTPLRSLSGDSAALRTYLTTISGPIVLVGHSYGGAVISDAATGNPHVRALVYVDAFAPENGESVLPLPGPNSALANPDPTQVFNLVPATLPPTPDTDLYVKPALFVTAFANDLPLRRARVLAATQRPVTLGALSESSVEPAWKTIPSWYEIGTVDKVIPADRQLSMARRAHAHISRAHTGHLPMVSDPSAVTATIKCAARATA